MAVMAKAGKVGITVEYGGRSATSPEAFAKVGRTLADAILNVLRHYKMLPGEAKYDADRTKGSQQPSRALIRLVHSGTGHRVPDADEKW